MARNRHSGDRSRRAWIGRAAAWLVALVPPLALAATPVQLCPAQIATPFPDGRLLGHILYLEAPLVELVEAPPGFAIGRPCLIQHDVAPDLARLIDAAAAAPGIRGGLRAVSCYRTVAHQRAVFCSQIGPHKRCKTAAERARTVGPPGYSEHGTGYALDFGVRPSAGCPDVNPCIATTPAGAWLLAHATEYGFELSFPQGNAQGVTWEPWHWRWVGTSIEEPGAAKARMIFARARTEYPASPHIMDRPDDWLSVLRPPPVVRTPLIVAPAAFAPPARPMLRP